MHVLTSNAIELENPDNISMIVDIIKLLSSFGIDMNQVDVQVPESRMPSGLTALHYACWAAEYDRRLPPNAGIRPSIVKALLVSGIDVNKQDSREMLFGGIPVMEILCDKKTFR